jgi:hypothetical protein
MIYISPREIDKIDAAVNHNCPEAIAYLVRLVNRLKQSQTYKYHVQQKIKKDKDRKAKSKAQAIGRD